MTVSPLTFTSFEAQCSVNMNDKGYMGNPPLKRASATMRNKTVPASGSRPKHPWSRLRKALAAAAVAAVAIVVVLAVALLWRPSGAGRGGAHPSFNDAVVATGIPISAMGLALMDRTRVTIREDKLSDVMAAVLDRDDPDLPATIKDQVRQMVPPVIRTVAGCRICPEDITVYLKCKKGLSFYVTTVGDIRRRDDGGLDYTLKSASVGLIPLPISFFSGRGIVTRASLLDPADAGFAVTRFNMAQGSLTMDIERNPEGAR